MVSPYGVSWRIMSIFWLIIIKPLIRKFAEINPSVHGLSARSLPSDWHCNWSNYIFATLPSTEMLQVAPRRLGMTSTLEQCFPMHSPNRKRFEIPAWLYWRVIGMGVAGERKYTLQTLIKKEIFLKKDISLTFYENFILQLSLQIIQKEALF